MTFINYIFMPKLFKEYGEGFSQSYESPIIEGGGDLIIFTLSVIWSTRYYLFPLILIILYQRGYFVIDSIRPFLIFITIIGILVVLTLCMRGIGRSQSQNYRRFRIAYSLAKDKPNDEEARVKLKTYEFDFKYWPVDFDADVSKFENATDLNRIKPIWLSLLPIEILANLAIHTFGIRMIYPGSVEILQLLLENWLVEGRAKLIEEEKAIRYKVRTYDNEIDTVFVDYRNLSSNGRSLVICSEGNFGFYEYGIMKIPLEKNYSLLGWNHPGFAGSSGTPFPEQEQHAIESVMQLAVHKLGFTPNNIILFGWSIGGYSALYLASRYPDIKGIILDATFDDLLPLAISRMPWLSIIVNIAIRNYVNLNNTELINQYNGPILMIRRTEDQIMSIKSNLTTNHGNHLLLAMLKHRFPNIFDTEQILYIFKLLSKSLEDIGNGNDSYHFSLLKSYITDNNNINYPLEIGVDYTEAQKNQLAEFLVRKHMVDYKSDHNTPLPAEYFQTPWNLFNENGG